MAALLAMPMAAATIVVAVWAVILSFVTINIEQPVPTQIKVIVIMAAQIPATKIVIPPQPVGIALATPHNVVPVVARVATSVC